MRGVYFDWRNEEEGNYYSDMSGYGKQIGLIAQEVKEIVPELAYTHSVGQFEEHADGIMAVRYTQTSALLVEAIKELTAKVEALENA